MSTNREIKEQAVEEIVNKIKPRIKILAIPIQPEKGICPEVFR